MSYTIEHKSQSDRPIPRLQQPRDTIFVDDESTEASIRQRIRHLEYNLFDEYWDELEAYREQIGATR